MTDPHKGIEAELEAELETEDPITDAPDQADEEAGEEAAADQSAAPPADLNATVTLSPEALAALLEEVKRGKRGT